jgi:hypothetical protein
MAIHRSAGIRSGLLKTVYEAIMSIRFLADENLDPDIILWSIQAQLVICQRQVLKSSPSNEATASLLL